MSLDLLYYIPFIAPLYWFGRTVHRAAIYKFLTLWLFSILPLVFAGLQVAIAKEDKILPKFFGSVLAEFDSSSLLIYSVSFLVPMLYMSYERLRYVSHYAYSRRSAPSTFRLPAGYDFVLIVSVFVFLFSAFVYGQAGRPDTVLGRLLDLGVIWVVYLYSIYCWYLTILIELFGRGDDTFVESMRQEETDFSRRFAERVRGDADDQE